MKEFFHSGQRQVHENVGNSGFYNYNMIQLKMAYCTFNFFKKLAFFD